ncbi:alpha/beta hydrolase [Virgisporangium aliadipatigenens]|uniref:Alpha/beta hydrolase n=1 Tax=Virgisporangium aliadipatigenens TaxID=741659 RepID=A0A8J3YN96_9ACTN|nr:alpha/beta fold hydrolase [Virgisporangium aliadipatigenens]GIJ46941.1 alpha/beta hydrolase [Virgisporangium aliadipatigenens]
MKKTTAVLTAALLLAGGAAVPARASSGIAWHACATGADDEIGTALDAAGARCGDLAVPLDFRRPRGRTITVALARIPATDRAQRRGALMVNPGGPGDAALGLALEVARSAPPIAAKYDLIGMDPRFVGRSSPLPCAWRDGFAMRSAGADRRAFEEGVAGVRDRATECAGVDPELLRHASTRETARDMDAVRAALGEPKLSYVGWSYGGYLGAVYTQLFPRRVDRFVLDSATGPDGADFRAMGAPTEEALRHWAAWAAARDDTYRLGATTEAVMSTVDGLFAAPPIDAHLLPLVFFLPLRFEAEDTYATLANDVRAFTQGSHEVPESLAPLLGPAQGTDGMPTFCADRAVSRDPETYWRDIEAHRADEPHFGPLTRNLDACAFWPVRPVERLTRLGNAAPVLMVGSTGDPRTPYPGQLATHRALKGSRLVTLEGAYNHTVFGIVDNACVDDTVLAYLLGGALPAANVTCAGR